MMHIFNFEKFDFECKFFQYNHPACAGTTDRLRKYRLGRRTQFINDGIKASHHRLASHLAACLYKTINCIVGISV